MIFDFDLSKVDLPSVDREYIENLNKAEPTEICRMLFFQNCRICDNLECCDNRSMKTEITIKYKKDEDDEK